MASEISINETNSQEFFSLREIAMLRAKADLCNNLIIDPTRWKLYAGKVISLSYSVPDIYWTNNKFGFHGPDQTLTIMVKINNNPRLESLSQQGNIWHRQLQNLKNQAQNIEAKIKTNPHNLKLKADLKSIQGQIKKAEKRLIEISLDLSSHILPLSEAGQEYSGYVESQDREEEKTTSGNNNSKILETGILSSSVLTKKRRKAARLTIIAATVLSLVSGGCSNQKPEASAALNETPIIETPTPISKIETPYKQTQTIISPISPDKLIPVGDFSVLPEAPNKNTQHESHENIKQISRINEKLEKKPIKNYPNGEIVAQEEEKSSKPEISRPVNSNKNLNEINYRPLTQEEKELFRIVDRAHPLEPDYVPKLARLKDHKIPATHESITVAAQIIEPLKALIEGAHEAGINDIYVGSGYRSYNTQKTIYERADDKRWVALPGSSQHQTGRAVDFTCESIGFRIDSRAGFENTPAYRFLIENAHKYGFVMTYRKDIGHDGIPKETWHFYYVGKELAQAYHKLIKNGWNGDIFDLLYKIQNEGLLPTDHEGTIILDSKILEKDWPLKYDPYPSP